MALRNILEKGESALEKHCRPITEFTPRIHELLDDMRETLMEANGVGLAAPQVGVLRRAVLVLETNVGEDEEPYIIELLNPEIVETSGEQTGAEGCLSVPGVYGIVTRPDTVTVKAQDRFGESFTVTGHGLTARAFCHEIDHLEGILFLSKAERILDPDEVGGDEEDE